MVLSMSTVMAIWLPYCALKCSITSFTMAVNAPIGFPPCLRGA